MALKYPVEPKVNAQEDRLAQTVERIFFDPEFCALMEKDPVAALKKEGYTLSAAQVSILQEGILDPIINQEAFVARVLPVVRVLTRTRTATSPVTRTRTATSPVTRTRTTTRPATKPVVSVVVQTVVPVPRSVAREAGPSRRTRKRTPRARARRR